MSTYRVQAPVQHSVNVKTVVGFQPGEGPSRGLLRDCEALTEMRVQEADEPRAVLADPQLPRHRDPARDHADNADSEEPLGQAAQVGDGVHTLYTSVVVLLFIGLYNRGTVIIHFILDSVIL